ncbi:MAG: putative cephalosporin hydroxylase [Solirubrobacterales bacterium]|nr:putative cephalosporin hydroxylase [Solirubrobacterales bacterium]
MGHGQRRSHGGYDASFVTAIASSAAADFGRIVTVQTPEGARDIDIYSDEGYSVLSQLWTRSGWQRKSTYELVWMGIPIIQLPEDILMMQELIWRVRPDVIIESGVAHGGALILYSSLLDAIGKGQVIGVDIEIRKYNRLAIEAHPMSKRIKLIEGDSVSDDTLARVRAEIPSGATVMVALDSNHTREHVAAELERYAPLVTPGSYCVVFDSVMTMVSDAPNAGENWEQDNPLEAVSAFLAEHAEFEVDRSFNRLEVTYCESGFLRRLEADTELR